MITLTSGPSGHRASHRVHRHHMSYIQLTHSSPRYLCLADNHGAKHTQIAQVLPIISGIEYPSTELESSICRDHGIMALICCCCGLCERFNRIHIVQMDRVCTLRSIQVPKHCACEELSSLFGSGSY